MTTTVPHVGTSQPLALELAARFPGVVTADTRPGFSGFIVAKDSLIEVATTIRDELGFDLLTAVTAVDFSPPPCRTDHRASDS